MTTGFFAARLGVGIDAEDGKVEIAVDGPVTDLGDDLARRLHAELKDVDVGTIGADLSGADLVSRAEHRRRQIHRQSGLVRPIAFSGQSFGSSMRAIDGAGDMLSSSRLQRHSLFSSKPESGIGMTSP